MNVIEQAYLAAASLIVYGTAVVAHHYTHLSMWVLVPFSAVFLQAMVAVVAHILSKKPKKPFDSS